MSVDLVRVDDRLIHGQVVVGWGRALRTERIALVDDTIADNEWEQDLYRMGVPSGTAVEFASVESARGAFAEWAAGPERTIVLLGDVATLERLCEVVEVTRVNLGGIHRDGDRRERLPYVFLSDVEVAQLRQLGARGIQITAQDVPTARPVALGELTR